MLPRSGTVIEWTARALQSRRWMPTTDEMHTNAAASRCNSAWSALLLLTLIGGVFVYSNRSNDHPAVLQPGTPVSTPTARIGPIPVAMPVAPVWVNPARSGTRSPSGVSRRMARATPPRQPSAIPSSLPAATGRSTPSTGRPALRDGNSMRIPRGRRTDRGRWHRRVRLVDVDGQGSTGSMLPPGEQQIWLIDGAFDGIASGQERSDRGGRT